MLPTTKLFKTIDCPFYDSAKSESCTRPYCHFNHAKPEIVQKQQTSEPIYIPTPKHILEARKAQQSTETSSEPPDKKKRLEYVPESKTGSIYPIPTYIPSKLNSTENLEQIENTINSVNNVNNDDITGLLKELSSEQQSDNENHSENVPKSDIDPAETEKKLSSHSSTSSSSSKDRHSRHKSSRSHSSSSSRSDRDRKSSSSKSKHKSVSSSSSSSSSSKKTKHSEKSSSSSSSSPSKRHSERKSSTSSSSSSSKHRSKGHSDKSSKKPEQESKRNNASIVYEMDSEEDDDIEAQCRMIFDEYTPEEKPNEEESLDKPIDTVNSDKNNKSDDTLAKKRVAHENADKPLLQYTQSKNHVQNAMQSVFLRQEIVRKQLEAKEEKMRRSIEKREAEQLEEKRKSLEAEKRKSLEAEKRKAALEIEQEKTKTNLTPLISPAVLQPPPRFGPNKFSPVSNLLAIERAKEKVKELKAQKLALHQQLMPKPKLTPPQPTKTIAQTATKGSGRIAHTNNSIQDNKPAPPVLEPTSSKISYNIRMQYYNMMVKHCLTIYDNCNDAWERAQTEELAIFKKCNTVVIYKSSALLAVNKLRKESLDAGNVNTEKNKVISHDLILAGKHAQNTSWNVNRKLSNDGPTNLIDICSSTKAYEMIAELCMTDEQLRDNGYPRPCDGKPGYAKIFSYRTNATPVNENERYCRRCGNVFNLSEFDEDCVDRCNYHPKTPGFRRGFADNSHRCCQQPAGSPGCMYANYHVTDYLDPNNLTGFIKTIACDDDYVPSRKDVFALDCEMCYTTVGLELTRVTVVDINRKIILDALVKPDNKIIDYNTTYSGISEKTLSNVTRTLRDVQAVLLSMFNSKTILIGHSLESDFKALKLIHDCVVDTSILFPHKMGPPKKRALKTLCIENLKRIIQEDEAGHNSAEDAEVCIDLVKHYLRNRIK